MIFEEQAKRQTDVLERAKYYELAARTNQDPYLLYRAARNFQEAAEEKEWIEKGEILIYARDLFEDIQDDQPKAIERIKEIESRAPEFHQQAKRSQTTLEKADLYEISGLLDPDGSYSLYRAARNYQKVAVESPLKKIGMLRKALSIYQEIQDKEPLATARINEVQQALEL